MTSRVLLVEDNEVNSYLIRFVLERAGYAVQVADQWPRGHRGSAPRAPRPDPDGHRHAGDGRLRSHRAAESRSGLSGVPVVALSAHAMEHEKERAYQAGCVAHIEKPIDMTTFIRQVQTHLRPLAL
jgi:CheY-like chemotaxis protein